MKFLEVLGLIFLAMILLALLPFIAVLTIKILEIMIAIFFSVLGIALAIAVVASPFILLFLVVHWTYHNFGGADRNRTDI